jgi:Uncharacterized conserved protein
MTRCIYPAVLTPEDTGYSIWLYDIDGCVSQGESIVEAVENILEAFELFCLEFREKKIEFPEATHPAQITLDDGQFIALIDIDPSEYQKKFSNKAVRKNCTIPAWMNAIAEKQNINFSAVLQDALTERLNLN